MSERALSDSYVAYKRDTDTVAAWLAQTARKCGIEVPPSLRAAATKKKSKKATSSKPYVLSLAAFSSIAKSMAGRMPPVTVPTTVVKALENAIAKRKKHGSILLGHISGISQTSHKSHEYFVTVLEGVQSTLRPFFQTASVKKPTDTADWATNRFETMEIDEPIEEVLDSVAQGDKPPVKYEAERGDPMEEGLLAFFMFLEDVYSLRRRLHMYWQDYRDGKADLSAVSLATNTATDLVRNMELEVERLLEGHLPPNIPHDEPLVHLSQVVYHADCATHGEDHEKRERPGDDFNYATYEWADARMMPASMTLKGFADVLYPGEAPVYKSGFFGTYDPERDPKALTAREKQREAKILLVESLTDFWFACTQCASIPGEDELIRGLRIFFQTKKLSIWTTFAATLYTDIHFILRDDAKRGYHDLFASATQIGVTVRQNLLFHKKLRIPNWPESNDRNLQGLLYLIDDWVRNDLVNAHRARATDLEHVPNHTFMRRHPLFCGLFSTQLRLLLHELGIAFVNAWGSIMYPAHLYRSLKARGLCDAAWQDMELMLEAQNLALIGSGDKEQDPEMYLYHFGLSLGMSASNLASGREKVDLRQTNKGPAILQRKGPVVNMFKNRLCKMDSRFDLTPADVELILDKSEFEETPADGGKVFLERADKDATKQVQKPRTVKPSPEHLVHRLLHAATAELLDLSVDYFAMHRTCWQLLRNVHEATRASLTNTYGPGYLEHENQLPFVVGYIFMSATGADKVAKQLQLVPPRSGMKATSVTLVQAGGALAEYISKNDGQVVETWRKRFGLAIKVE